MGIDHSAGTAIVGVDMEVGGTIVIRQRHRKNLGAADELRQVFSKKINDDGCGSMAMTLEPATFFKKHALTYPMFAPTSRSVSPDLAR